MIAKLIGTLRSRRNRLRFRHSRSLRGRRRNALETLEDRCLLAITLGSDIMVNEPDSGGTDSGGTANAVFNVRLTQSSDEIVTVDYTTVDGSAFAPLDYAPQSGTLQFNPGTTSLPITVAVNGDQLFEDDESFFMELSNPVGDTLGTSLAQAFIVDNDIAPTIDDASVVEGDSGFAVAMFTVTLPSPRNNDLTLQFETFDETATAGADYIAVNGDLIIAAGETTATISVPVRGDTVVEADETFGLALSQRETIANATEINEFAIAVGTILDDDVRISIADATVTEGDEGDPPVEAVFAVTLSQASPQTITVDFATEDGTAVSSTFPDFTARAGQITFAPGQTRREIRIPIAPDAFVEPNEVFRVVLSNASGALLVESEGLGTIIDNDAQIGAGGAHGSISGRKWHDLNADGVIDPGEPGIGGVYIYLDLNNDGRIGVDEPAAITRNDGSFTIENVSPGVYAVREVVPFGWQSVFPTQAYLVGLKPGRAITGLRFGNVRAVDFGDAPDGIADEPSYPTLAANNGASHGVVPSFRLGRRIDSDPDGQPTAEARGDDIDGSNDDDGVFFTSGLEAGEVATITVTASVNTGYLQGWIDFNADGDWDDPGEQVVRNALLAPGENTLTFLVPASAGVLDADVIRYARFRYGPEMDLAYFGPSVVGEVEDYAVTVPFAPDNGLTILDDMFVVNEDDVLNEPAPGVLDNDSDRLDFDLSASLVTGPENGTLVLNADGSFIYTPDANFFGPDSFVYRATSPDGRFREATVDIDVLPVNDDPTANDDIASADSGVAEDIFVLLNDTTEPDDEPDPIVSAVDPISSQGGTVTIGPGGAFVTYLSAAGFLGEDSFDYTISDINGSTDTATVTVFVGPANPIVDIIFVAADDFQNDGGMPLATDENGVVIVNPGQSFVLQVYVEDLGDPSRPFPQGVFSAYMDVTYSTPTVAVNGPIQHNDVLDPGEDFAYGVGESGDTSTPGLINEVGSSSDISVPPCDADTEMCRFLLFEVPFTAVQSGGATFASNMADVARNQVLVFGLSPQRALGPQDIRFDTLDMLVGASAPAAFFNAASPFDVNDDGMVSPLDAMYVINEINAGGARELGAAKATSALAFAPQSVAPAGYVDINGDNLLSPLDAYLILNELGRLAGSEAIERVAATTQFKPHKSSALLAQPAAKLSAAELRPAHWLPDGLAAAETDDTEPEARAAFTAGFTQVAPSPVAGAADHAADTASTRKAGRDIATPAAGDDINPGLEPVLADIAEDIAVAWQQ